MMSSRFDADYDDPNIAWDPLIDVVFDELTSSFLEMPKGEGFIDYSTFEKGYQALKRHTNAFASTTTETVLAAVQETPIAFVVFRCILGLSPPEWAYVTADSTSTDVTQSAARVQRLRTLRDEVGEHYDVIACIAGRGFKVRREDMRRLLQATDGKVFTLTTMNLLIENTRISEYAIR